MAGCVSKPLPQGLTERDVEAVRRVRADDYAHTSLLLIKLTDNDTPSAAPAPHARWVLGIGITAGWEVYENAMFLLTKDAQAQAPSWDNAPRIIKQDCANIAYAIAGVAQAIEASIPTASPSTPEKQRT